MKLGVDPKFLDAVFKEFNISKGSAAIPDVAAHIEKTVDDANAQVLLSAEAYARFRRALGKLLWMAQVRHDLKIYLSLIGSQQAAPMSGTETAIRSILRFLYNDMSTMLSTWTTGKPKIFGRPKIFGFSRKTEKKVEKPKIFWNLSEASFL